MENKVLSFLRRYDMVHPGDTVICAVSGGADSIALLWCLWMLREKLDFTVEAAHFNHHLRGPESDRDEQFVRDFCGFHDIPLHVGDGTIVPGKKGLEAAAREARYAFLRSLKGTIATAHTADDNAETVLMHLIRGSGLRGLGGITPKSDGLIRPMLDVTRAEVEAYLRDNWISHVEDSSNCTDVFLRNRIRHDVMPLLKRENPSLAQNLSVMALRLRQDEQLLQEMAERLDSTSVTALREAHPSLRRRALEEKLRRNGFREPSASHILQAESVVLSENPSAMVRFGDLILMRSYDMLILTREYIESMGEFELQEWGVLGLPSVGFEIHTCRVREPEFGPDCYTVAPRGKMVVRSRKPGDMMTLPGGTKSLKKLFIDRKIPRHLRGSVPVVADEEGILCVQGIGPDEKRRIGQHLIRIQFVRISPRAEG